jgi:hypothetical protein
VGSTFKIFADTVANGGVIKVLRVPEVCTYDMKPRCKEEWPFSSSNLWIYCLLVSIQHHEPQQHMAVLHSPLGAFFYCVTLYVQNVWIIS